MVGVEIHGLWRLEELSPMSLSAKTRLNANSLLILSYLSEYTVFVPINKSILQYSVSIQMNYTEVMNKHLTKK